MSIFDHLKKAAQGAAAEALRTGESRTFHFKALPESVEEMKLLPEAALLRSCAVGAGRRVKPSRRRFRQKKKIGNTGAKGAQMFAICAPFVDTCRFSAAMIY